MTLYVTHIFNTFLNKINPKFRQTKSFYTAIHEASLSCTTVYLQIENGDDIHREVIQEQGVKNRKEWVSCFHLMIKLNNPSEAYKELYSLLPLNMNLTNAFFSFCFYSESVPSETETRSSSSSCSRGFGLIYLWGPLHCYTRWKAFLMPPWILTMLLD